ncbi:MAG TPA: hypothetical protein VNA25_16675 [Phycisphaerae bacterium]|nr:hypothetical protein [Phycisphaerae bacterium]
MRHTLLAMAAVGLVLTAATTAAAQAPTKPAGVVKLGDGRGQVTLSWDEFVKITGYDPARKSQQMLTIPWKDVQSLLGVELKGKVPMDRTTVDLPWGDFKKLLEWSVRRQHEDLAPPPTDYIVSASEYAGALSADAATFTLKLKLQVLRKAGWKRIPILPISAAVSAATLPEGVHLNAAEKRYELLTEKAGPIEATVEFSVPVTKSAGIHMVAFERVVPGSSTVELKIAGEKADVKIPGAPWVKTDADNTTHAAIPSGQPMNITWERALPKVAAAPTKLYADTRTLVAVSEDLLVCQQDVSFNILHTAVRELKMTVPAGVSVLDASGRSVEDWRVDKGELLLVLRGEVIGGTTVRVVYETPAKDAAEAPVLRAAGVERERGFVGVIALANVEITAGKVEGATEIDVKRLPADIAAMTKQPILLGFRYTGEKLSIPLTIKKHGEVGVLTTIVDSALFTMMQLNDGRRMTRVIYTVRNNRNQFLRTQMPAGAEIWSAAVGGETVSPAADEKKNVLIPLIRSTGASGMSSFPVELVYVETPDKPAPTTGRLHVELPRLNTPIMHVMVNYYLPAEGRYQTPGGLFSSAKSGFSGSLRMVSEFASMTTDRGGQPVAAQPQKQAQAMQEQFEAKMEAQARAAGVTPIRVRLPLDGKLYKLEKILALQGDVLFLEVQYRGWRGGR